MSLSVSTDVIVGVNKYKLAKEEPVEVLSIDNSKVLEIQVQTLVLYVAWGLNWVTFRTFCKR